MSKFIFVYYHFLIFLLTNLFLAFIIIFVITNGDVAQLARANGSYPLGQRFESTHRYQNKQSTLNGRFIFYIIKVNVTFYSVNVTFIIFKINSYNPLISCFYLDDVVFLKLLLLFVLFSL